MDARSIGDMIGEEHPQVVAIILSVLEYDVAADVLNFLPQENRAEIMQRVASLRNGPAIGNGRARRHYDSSSLAPAHRPNRQALVVLPPQRKL